MPLIQVQYIIRHQAIQAKDSDVDIDFAKISSSMCKQYTEFNVIFPCALCSIPKNRMHSLTAQNVLAFMSLSNLPLSRFCSVLLFRTPLV